MRITIAGMGYVGLVAGVCFAEMGHEVLCVDVDNDKINMLIEGIAPIYEPDLEYLMKKNYDAKRIDYTTDYVSAYKNSEVIFIGVGTPQLPDGSANLDYVSEVSRQIAENIENDCLIVVKSTVPIGTNDKIEQFIKDSLVNEVNIEVASNPEFLAQGTAVKDTLKAERIIIGTESENAKKLLCEIYKPFNLPIVNVSRRSAEMIKYACNDFLALKISYINEIANLCDLVGANIEEVAKGMSYDRRIGNSFLGAGVGYGGSCFPKDTKALKYLAKQKGHKLKTIEAAVKVNEEQKIVLYKKASNRIMSFNGVKVAILGLTFKPGTDDIREAPSIDNVKLLMEQGADIRAYDPVGAYNFKQYMDKIQQQYKGTISYKCDILSTLKDADICFIFTEWDEIKELSPEVFKTTMRIPLVYDGRNIFDLEEMKNAGIEYYSVGRGK